MDRVASQVAQGGKESVCQCRRCRRHRFDPWVAKIPWRREWQPTPVFLPGESPGPRSLAGYSPRGLQSRRRLSDWAHTYARTGYIDHEIYDYPAQL